MLVYENGIVYEIVKEKTGSQTVEIKISRFDMMYNEESGEFVPALPPEPLPLEPSEIDILGKQLAEKELQILQLQADNEKMGQSIVNLELKLMNMEGK